MVTGLHVASKYIPEGPWKPQWDALEPGVIAEALQRPEVRKLDCSTEMSITWWFSVDDGDLKIEYNGRDVAGDEFTRTRTSRVSHTPQISVSLDPTVEKKLCVKTISEQTA
jgi:hypothetical protein